MIELLDNNGYNDLLVIIDRYTKYTMHITYNFETDHLISVVKVAVILFFHIICYFKVPVLIV